MGIGGRAVFLGTDLIHGTKCRVRCRPAFLQSQNQRSAVQGVDEFTHQWMDATWRFATAENRDAFVAHPEAYAPQYGGYCAFAVSHNFTKTVQPDLWKIVDGKLYLNYNKTTKRRWQRDQNAAITRGDANWPTVLLECEKNGNCR